MENRRIIWGAFAVSLLLHIVFAVATWRIPFVSPDPSLAAEHANELELFLVPMENEPPPEESDTPQAFTSVPDRLASEEPPDDPDYLALHHSLAADQTQDSDGDAPAADEVSDINQVQISREDLSGSAGIAYSEQPLPREESGAPETERGEQGQDEPEPTEADDELGEWALPRHATDEGQEGEQEQADEEKTDRPSFEEWWGGHAPSILKEGDQSASGDRGFDFDQKATGVAGSGVSIVGPYSLNTYEWAFAPWMSHFANELHRHWMAPYAYRLGVIHGYTVIELVVEKDGRPSSMQVLETEGHESLHDASVAALKAFVPYAPLPADFPEEQLVIRLGLHYPAWR